MLGVEETAEEDWAADFVGAGGGGGGNGGDDNFGEGGRVGSVLGVGTTTDAFFLRSWILSL